MPANRVRTSRFQLKGFTLLELLLVLGILVAVSALAVPALRGPMESYRLRRSADLIRAAWVKARNDAIKSGNIQVFHYEVNGNLYYVEPWFTGEDELQASGASSPTPPPLAAGASVSAGTTLPESILFVSGETASDTRLAAMDPSSAAAGGANSAAPIVFYPDGTTSTARVIIQNQQEQFIVLDLRGLTGVAQVSDLLAGDELPQ